MTADLTFTLYILDLSFSSFLLISIVYVSYHFLTRNAPIPSPRMSTSSETMGVPSVAKNASQPAATMGLAEPDRSGTLGSGVSGEEEPIINMPFLNLFQVCT